MAITKPGRNHLRWCGPCNLPVMESAKCPLCGGPTFETPLTPPADSRPAFPYDIERAGKLCDGTFGKGTGKVLLPDGHAAIMNKAPAIDRMEEVFCDGAVLATLRYGLGAGWRFIIRPRGAFRIASAMTRVRILPEVVPFIRKDKNLMVPGICGADRDIREHSCAIQERSAN